MKKIYLFVLLFSLTINVSAQIFSAGFENNNGTPLSAFKKVNNDSLTLSFTAQIQDFNTEAWIQFYDGYDNKIAFSTSYYLPAGQSDDWLITPAIEIPNSGTPTLYWKAKSYSLAQKADYDVRISATNDSITSFNDTLLSVTEEQPFDFKSHQLDLSAYKGQTIYIAFVNVTYDGYYLALDDMYVSKSADCVLPTIDNLDVSNLSENGFTVAWEANPAISSYDTGLTTFDVPVSSTGVQSSTTKTYTNLTPGTRYQFFLKNDDCGSGWSRPYSVWTAFLPPYSYDFESTEENFGEYGSDGWSSSTWLISSGNNRAQSGENYVYNNTNADFDSDNWIYSPPIKLDANEKLVISYYAHSATIQADSITLQLAVASLQNKADNSEIIASEVLEGTDDYQHYTATFIPEESGVYYIGFGNVTPAVETTGPVRLDNIEFKTESLGLPEPDKTAISLYPNPVKNVLHLNSTTPIQAVQVYSITGKSLNLTVDNNRIDFSAVSPGVYFIKIKQASGITVKKIIKQ